MVARSRRNVVLSGFLLACLTLAVALVVFSCSADNGSEEGAPTAAPWQPPNAAPTGATGEVAGYVRDVNGYPVPGAEVSVVGDPGEGDRADSDGRFELRVPGAKTTLVAKHPGYTTQHVALANEPSEGRLDFSLATTDPAGAQPNSADRVIFWTRCEDVAELGEGDLDRLVALGVDGFVCSITRLQGMGGEHAFSDGAPDDDAHRLQRALSSSAVVRRARAGDLKLYLGFYASNAANTETPFEEWFDDEAWSGELLPKIRDLAAAVRSLGFAGVAVDQELYPLSDEVQQEPSWFWDYPGNERPEDEVRAKVRQRGGELMRALLEGYPGIELAAYDTALPETWSAKVQEVVNDIPDAFGTDVRIDLWDGLSSVPGYAAIRWFDPIFYKTPHLTENWETALSYNANRVYSLLSRRFSNWAYASSRLHLSPFSWIDAGPSEHESARSPDYVATQLTAFSRWGTGGSFANYTYQGVDDFDYAPYTEAMQEATTPSTVELRPPKLTVGAPENGEELELSGTARSAFALRAVHWYDDRGGFGTAELHWDVDGEGISEPQRWSTSWRVDGVPAPPGGTRITIVAEDIKGLATTRSVTVTP